MRTKNNGTSRGGIGGGLFAALALAAVVGMIAACGPAGANLLNSLVANATPKITTTTLSDGGINLAYSATISASGGTGPYTWSLATGSSLPAGLTMATTVGTSITISGTPTTTGVFTFTLEILDSEGKTGSKALSLTVIDPFALPASDTWSLVYPGLTSTSTGAPAKRFGHTAVWTGSTMIIWGGDDETGNSLDDGAIYDPATGAWTYPTGLNSSASKPTPRAGHSAVWTGTEMIIFAGSDGTALRDCYAYNPSTDAWAALKTMDSIAQGTNPPTALEKRYYHIAEWTGATGDGSTANTMIIWGGYDGTWELENGGTYTRSNDTWVNPPPDNLDTFFGAQQTQNNPEMPNTLWGMSSIWTGNTGNVNTENKLILFGGYDGDNSITLKNGYLYDLKTDAWSTSFPNLISTTAFTLKERELHRAIWTGSQMIVWGGRDGNAALLANGAIYDPSTDSWVTKTKLNAGTGAPSSRIDFSMVWDDVRDIAIVWGGRKTNSNGGTTTVYGDGGIYVP